MNVLLLISKYWNWIGRILWYRRSNRNNCNPVCHSVFFQETDEDPICIYRNQDSHAVSGQIPEIEIKLDWF